MRRRGSPTRPTRPPKDATRSWRSGPPTGRRTRTRSRQAFRACARPGWQRRAGRDLRVPRPRAGEGFGNGRSARQIFQQMTERQAHRLAGITAPTPDQLVSLEAADIPMDLTAVRE
ncbi:hypothetical protein [Kribbella qitaiheensis]|uniref:hypothetical protein n=1 Tax=Kribbella qitaiheensis TaxID=1544730 RepID=UPI00162813AB|nr:hypothetical protein [Kribbella qitaiheensis]